MGEYLEAGFVECGYIEGDTLLYVEPGYVADGFFVGCATTPPPLANASFSFSYIFYPARTLATGEFSYIFYPARTLATGEFSYIFYPAHTLKAATVSYLFDAKESASMLRVVIE